MLVRQGFHHNNNWRTARSRSSDTKELARRRARGRAATGSGLRSARRGVHRRRLCPLAVTGVDDAEHCRHEEQRRTGGEEQAIGMAPMAIEPGQNAPLGRAVIGDLR
jgi:hypothetical protein